MMHERLATPRLLALVAGYFGLVFAAGFALDVARFVLVQPYLGAGPSRLLALPLLLAMGFLAARRVLRHAGPVMREDALAIGFAAFFLLLLAQMLVGQWLFRLPYSALFTGAMTPIGLIHLLAQGLVIVFPALVAAREAARP